MTSLRKSARLAALSVAALALGSSLAACGSSSKDAAPKDAVPQAQVLSEAEATTALLTEGNLGGKFKGEPGTPDDGQAPGCLQDIAKFVGDGDTAKTHIERDFNANDQATNIYISDKVLSYKTVAEAKKVMADTRRILAGCDTVKDTDSDGFTYDVTVTTDDDKASSDADDQVNGSGTGTVSATDGGGGKIGLYLALVRVGNNIAALSGSTIDTDLPGPISDVVKVISDRLLAVVAGKVPDESVVAGA